VKAIGQCLQLLWILLGVAQKPDFVLVQNPPALPTLAVALLAARVRSAKLVIDWHNFGYTMLSLKMGRRHPVVRLARWYERIVGRYADVHFCVSRAMQEELQAYWGIRKAIVLYDRPAEMFAPTPVPIRHDLLRRLQNKMSFPVPGYRVDGPDRPALIVSATSWTADEDFSVLLDAVSHCEKMICKYERESRGRPFPPLWFFITGEGPLRTSYEDRIARLALRKIRLYTLWLSAEDYPLLLGTADLGLCLHRSSSGLDLPMKVADMFGSGLPVCALDYGPCLAEQVRHGENGLIFSTSTDLANQLYNLFKGFPHDTPLLNHLRRNVSAGSRVRWAEEWKANAQSVFWKA
jgi:beta-1,4-mannosyltransferase